MTRVWSRRTKTHGSPEDRRPSFVTGVRLHTVEAYGCQPEFIELGGETGSAILTSTLD